MRVSDLMSRNVVTIEDAATCLEAVNRMCQRKVRHLPVLDSGGTLVGLVTDRDLRHYLFGADRLSTDRPGTCQHAPARRADPRCHVGARAQRHGLGRGGGSRRADAAGEGGLPARDPGPPRRWDAHRDRRSASHRGGRSVREPRTGHRDLLPVTEARRRRRRQVGAAAARREHPCAESSGSPSATLCPRRLSP